MLIKKVKQIIPVVSKVVQSLTSNSETDVPSVKAVNEGIASIVETVTNDNGTAIKFSDGTMICAGEIFLENVNITNQDGIFYYGQLNPVNLPCTFISNPITTMEVDSVDPAYALFLRSTGNGSSLAQTPQKIITSISSVVATKLKIHYQAIGRWK